MKNIKVMVSPNFSKEEFVDSVSGITFKKDPRGGLRVYGISISDERLTGIHDALRRNILIPADNETRKFINEGRLVKAMKPEVKPEPAKEEVKEQKEEKSAVEEAPKAKVASESSKKSSRKRAPKKQAEPKAEKQAEEAAE